MDWDAVEVTQTPEETQQYVTLYESVAGFDEQAVVRELSIPRPAFAGAKDTITDGRSNRSR
jgi:glutaredoxin-related protein